ncbi:MAG TPA: SAM-dependent methyltransferase [Chitinophagaceae bacterium]|nr:SAM-dependent methyltransferase [Chitinophagaceae bacterium]
MSSLIENISDTAKWVAIFRAEESERPDAVFHDPFARRLAGEKGKQIANAVEFSKKNSWSFVARTFLFDEFIMRHVNQGFDMIINLAAGLDARPYRMKLPSSLQWIEVDLPGIISEKEKILDFEKPNCDLRRIQLDLSDEKERLAIFIKLNNEADKALVISEGLMIYLTSEEVGSLATDLSSQKNFRNWLFDMVSPGLLIMARDKMGSALEGSNAEFQFAPEEGEAFFLKYGWKNIESRSKLKTAAAINRLDEEMLKFAAIPEPEGPKGQFPWSGACLFENINK